MEFNIEVGMKNIQEKKVQLEDTASKYGSGAVEVFATPAMVALMENTSKNAIDKHLPEGYTTVGIRIDTTHIKATPVGMNIGCEAIVESIDGKKISFKVKAWDEQGVIGEGIHNRFIINIDKFMAKIKY